MTTYFASHALLPDGWKANVRLTVDAFGTLASIEADQVRQPEDEFTGMIVPGMPNLHSHAFQRAMAGLTEVATDPKDSFWSWRAQMYRMLEQIGPEDVLAIARQLYIDMLKAGFTSVAEFHYLHHDLDGQPYAPAQRLGQAISQAASESGIGLTLLPVFYAHSGFGGQPPEQGQRRFIHSQDSYLRLYENLTQELAGIPTQRTGLCFHSLRAVTPEQISATLAVHQPGTPVHIHIAEQQKEVDTCLSWSGQRPVAWLMDNAPVDQDWCLVHATHLDEHEVKALASSQAIAGLCITTEANLGDGLFPADQYLAAGGRFGIGSDSHISLSVVEELRWLEYGQRLRDQGRCRLSQPDQPAVADYLYQASCLGGAQALGQKIGQLTVGYRADWLRLDDHHPLLQIASDTHRLSRWLFASERNLIQDVMVNGQWAIREGQHLLQDNAANDYLQTLKRLNS
ncbi:formimidoylglutamate deiminase [Pokkaliibacter sp. CJK22405]|uniref:formimidoylglutamate deiminase n=1 Tax=Pokkaliibacter sp. CJK22405 TaxID=3384615 RepID=UPI0039853975